MNNCLAKFKAKDLDNDNKPEILLEETMLNKRKLTAF